MKEMLSSAHPGACNKGIFRAVIYRFRHLVWSGLASRSLSMVQLYTVM